MNNNEQSIELNFFMLCASLGTLALGIAREAAAM